MIRIMRLTTFIGGRYLTLFAICLLAGISFSQNRSDWITFVPESKSFSVRLPAYPIKGLTGERVVQGGSASKELALFRCTKSIDYYSLRSIFDGPQIRLLIREIDISGCSSMPNDLERDATAFLLHITGNIKTFHRDKPAPLKDLMAREILYESGFSYTKDSKIYNRILLVKTLTRVFVITYYRNEGTIGEEDDIFTSFQLTCANTNP